MRVLRAKPGEHDAPLIGLAVAVGVFQVQDLRGVCDVRPAVPGRDVERYERWGIAPSVTVGLMGPTQATLAYVHQQDDNVPIYGVPYFRSLVNDGPPEEVDPSDYFGYRNLDEQATTVDRLTLTISHEF